MHRRLTTQDLTWLLDLNQNNQLDLDPPYQRRSVWTRNDKQFFLDTIFRNYPSPAIFLHTTIDETGKSTYHVDVAALTARLNELRKKSCWAASRAKAPLILRALCRG